MALKRVYLGETGSGKTYTSIKEATKKGGFIYTAPCRQLVYESYMKYGSENDLLTTGEVKITGNGNIFAVYESVTEKMLDKVDTLIIDEAHFISDFSRGGNLQNLMIYCFKNDINIFLVTATCDFEIKNFEIIELKSKFKEPKKIQIGLEEAHMNIKKGLQTIIFVGSIADTYHYERFWEEQGINCRAINSSISPSERLNIQLAFLRKEIQVVISTNVLAQGLNFQCENLIIFEDYYNDDKLLNQKLGRLGRPFLSSSEEVYYCTLEEISKNIKKKSPKLRKHEVDCSYIREQFNQAKYYLECGYFLEYSSIKYAIKEFKDYYYSLETPKENVEELYQEIIEENNNIKKILIENRGQI